MNNAAPMVASVLPLLMGGIVSYFKPFLEDQKEFKNRGAQIIAKQTEAISIALTRLLKEEIRSKDFDEEARGTGTSKNPDYYADASSSISKLCKLQYRVSRRIAIFRLCYTLLLLTFFCGLILFSIAAFNMISNPATICIAIIIMLIQSSSVATLYHLTRRSEDDEEIS